MKTTIDSCLYGLMFLVGLAVSPGNLSGVALQDVPPTPVARVYGDQIHLSDLSEGMDLGRTFRLQHQRDPGPEDAPLLEKLRLQLQRDRLERWIEDTIRERIALDLGVGVTQPEVDAAVKDRLQRLNQEGTRGQYLDQMSALVQALRASLSGSSDEEAYEMHLKEHFDRATWSAQRLEFGSVEKVAQMEGMLARLREHGVESSPMLQEVARRRLREERLEAAVDRLLAASDPEVAAYLKALETDDREVLDGFASRNPFFLRERRAAWWKAKYKDAPVEILDSVFKEVGRRLSADVKP